MTKTSEYKMLEIPVYAFHLARHFHFGWQFLAFDTLFRNVPGLKGPVRLSDPEVFRKVRQAYLDLLRQDAINIAEGVYPVQVLKLESMRKHLARIPRMFLDSLEIYRRRAQELSDDFDSNAQEMLDEVPKYYRRNFHFQTSGYLSERSADLYEHQVEMLFAGAADPMRRLILKPLRKHLGKSSGKGLRILEIAAGTGRATRFTRLTFPEARITVLDLSDPYLKAARKNLGEFSRIDFIRGQGEALPFQNESFDAVYSVFLFHELPFEIRKKVVQEAKRVLRSGGFFGLVDSVQNGDSPAFEPLLEAFPQSYHEPFYRDYISKPMEDLLKKEKFSQLKSEVGGSSKVLWGVKPSK